MNTVTYYVNNSIVEMVGHKGRGYKAIRAPGAIGRIASVDIMLPGISGYAVLKAVHLDMENTRPSTVMATSLSDQDAVLGGQGLSLTAVHSKGSRETDLGIVSQDESREANTLPLQLELAITKTWDSGGAIVPK
jgi:DNA-binding NarL/FixJ family response regulator